MVAEGDASRMSPRRYSPHLFSLNGRFSTTVENTENYETGIDKIFSLI